MDHISDAPLAGYQGAPRQQDEFWDVSLVEYQGTRWQLMAAILVHMIVLRSLTLNTFRPRQDGRYFADDVLKCIFLNENVWISLKIPLKFVPKGPINSIPALVQVMAWRRPGEKPLFEPMLVFVPTHICVTRPQWVNVFIKSLTLSVFIRCYDTAVLSLFLIY